MSAKPTTSGCVVERLLMRMKKLPKTISFSRSYEFFFFLEKYNRFFFVSYAQNLKNKHALTNKKTQSMFRATQIFPVKGLSTWALFQHQTKTNPTVQAKLEGLDRSKRVRTLYAMFRR